MHWIYLIHEFHNLSWITEINELFHDILIYWDAPVNMLGVAQYTDVTVRYVPRFGGHGLMWFWYNRKNIDCMLVSFHLFWTDSRANKKKKIHLDVKILIINTIIKLLYYI